MKQGSLVAAFFLLNFSFAEALDEGKLCYVLDGILVLYGLILTILYCRLRMNPVLRNSQDYTQEPPAYREGIYTGLIPHGHDTYDIIKVEKKPIV